MLKPATAIETGHITCASGASAYFAKPQGARDLPCALLLHERYGLVQHTRDLTDRLARDGFVVLAPDLYFRHPDQEALHRGDDKLDPIDPEVVADLDAAVAALTQVGGGDLDQLALLGFCQTGRYPIVYASSRPLGAACVFYGAITSPREWETSKRFPVKLTDLIKTLSCPVLGVFGEADHVISIEDVRRLRDTLEACGKSYEIHMLRDAPHGWMNETMPGRYHREATETAWRIMLNFLAGLGTNQANSRVFGRFFSDIAIDYDYAKNERKA